MCKWPKGLVLPCQEKLVATASSQKWCLNNEDIVSSIVTSELSSRVKMQVVSAWARTRDSRMERALFKIDHNVATVALVVRVHGRLAPNKNISKKRIQRYSTNSSEFFSMVWNGYAGHFKNGNWDSIWTCWLNFCVFLFGGFGWFCLLNPIAKRMCLKVLLNIEGNGRKFGHRELGNHQ